MIKKRKNLRKIEKEGFFKDIIINDIVLKDSNGKERKLTVKKQKKIITNWIYRFSNYNTSIKFKDIWPKEVKFPVKIISIIGYKKINIDIIDSNSQSFLLQAPNTDEYGVNTLYKVIKTEWSQGIEEEITYDMQLIPTISILKEKRIIKDLHDGKSYSFEKNKKNVTVALLNRGQKVQIKYFSTEEELNKNIESILWNGENWNIYNVISILKMILPEMNKDNKKINLKIETIAYGICGEIIDIESGFVKQYDSIRIVNEAEFVKTQTICCKSLENFLNEY